MKSNCECKAAECILASHSLLKWACVICEAVNNDASNSKMVTVLWTSQLLIQNQVFRCCIDHSNRFLYCQQKLKY